MPSKICILGNSVAEACLRLPDGSSQSVAIHYVYQNGELVQSYATAFPPTSPPTIIDSFPEGASLQMGSCCCGENIDVNCACIDGQKVDVQYGVRTSDGQLTGWYKRLDTMEFLTEEPQWVDCCADCGDDECLSGTGQSSTGVIKIDANPASLSQGTMENSYIEITYDSPCNGVTTIQQPITGDIEIGRADNGDPVILNFANAFNSIGGAFSAIDCGIDDGGTNMVLGYTVPTGLGNITTTVVTGGNQWTSTYNDSTGEFTVIDDNGDFVNGSAANK